ncbi:MAG: LysM peptidoglycan-binding domain-containing protein, partial [Anaerolineae bacterium]|nr:LysM peptidoglycan-binding domain-containing protein [Anaerolineae bacterium]
MQRNRFILALLLVLLIVAGVVAAQDTATEPYTVQRGETLNRIAQRYSITV